MIKFENDYIIDVLNSAILEYNNQFWAPKDADKQVGFYDEKVGISEETFNETS